LTKSNRHLAKFFNDHQNEMSDAGSEHILVTKVSPGGLLGRRTEYVPAIFFSQSFEMKIV